MWLCMILITKIYLKSHFWWFEIAIIPSGANELTQESLTLQYLSSPVEPLSNLVKDLQG